MSWNELGICGCCLLYRSLDKNGYCFDCWNKGRIEGENV